ncbi:MAG: amidohydrolase family protein [Candidatus Eremiobacteraeota bacterium]|nr:amidohydrolase family protein [Candidatus Eremiobacteraeota bacterium]
MVLDAHVHLGTSLFGHHMDENSILSSLGACGVDRCVLCPVKPFEYHLEPENDRVAKAVKAHGDRFTGFARVDPHRGTKAVEELARAVETLGLRGLYLDPWEETFQVNCKKMAPLMEKALEYKIPVMVRGGFPIVSHASQIGDLAGEWPGVTIIATSGGQINVSGGGLEHARQLLLRHSNVLMETSGIYREDFIEEMARTLGPERLVYGSGAPLFEMRFELERVRRAHLPPEAKKSIAGETMAALLAATGPSC